MGSCPFLRCLLRELATSTPSAVVHAFISSCLVLVHAGFASRQSHVRALAVLAICESIFAPDIGKDIVLVDDIALRCPARVQRAEQWHGARRILTPVAPLNAARTAQRAVPTYN
ncbi:MAG TPA: hypothetical protein VFE51_28060 [Verrucomicrobiae bacterium]|nr:hypothetical protein [Verrucomicrobiae bacterium]